MPRLNAAKQSARRTADTLVGLEKFCTLFRAGVIGLETIHLYMREMYRHPNGRGYQTEELSRRRESAESQKGIYRYGTLLSIGDISFDRFLRHTWDDFERLAQDLYRAYEMKLPEGVLSEDIAQVMRMETTRVLPTWNPVKRELGDFLVFNSYSKGKKWVNQQRNSKARSGKAPSQLPVRASNFIRDTYIDRDPIELLAGGCEASQESYLAGKEFYRMLKSTLGGRERRAIAAFYDPKSSFRDEQDAREVLQAPRTVALIASARRASI